MASALMPGARCAAHQDRGATGVCGRCGDYLCGLCGERVNDRLYCAECAVRLTRDHSGRSVQAFVLGMLGVCFLFFLSPIAAILGLLELQAIRAGEAPTGGEGMARAALYLGVIGIAIPISVAFVALAMHH